ncbi:MAG: hypothetical protein V1866_03875 [archaeon]
MKKTDNDPFKITSILRMADARLRTIGQIARDEHSASIIVESYYEIIKELLVALLLKHGLKSSNHECLISFFKEKFPNYEYEANIIYDLKDVRNGITYEGIFVKESYLSFNELEFKHIIDILKKLINK